MPKSVLIVDDSAQVRKVIRAFFEAHGDWIITGEAEDGAVAIRKAMELKPDLILLDYSMPVLNGVETASVLKKMLPGIFIVMFTMFDQAMGEELRSAIGVDLVVPKPEGLNNLLKSVQRSMEIAGLG